jgi:dTDP-glucose pyrophosphorylase
MSRPVLVIPAAGLGSRLGATVPKLLVPVGGIPMIDRLERLYKDVVSRIVLVVHPSFEAALQHHVSTWATPVACVVQSQPTGMLDAIMLATNPVRAAVGDGVGSRGAIRSPYILRPRAPWCRRRRRIRRRLS